jgi:hypothetical protein
VLSAAAVNARAATAEKICLAIYYNFVMMRGTYEENILFLWSWAVVAPADRMRVFGLFRC